MSFTGSLWILPSKYLGVCLLYLLSFSYLLKTSSPLVVYKAQPTAPTHLRPVYSSRGGLLSFPQILVPVGWSPWNAPPPTVCMASFPSFPSFNGTFSERTSLINLFEIRPYTHTHTLSLFLAVTVFLQTMLRIFNCILRALRKQWKILSREVLGYNCIFQTSFQLLCEKWMVQVEVWIVIGNWRHWWSGCCSPEIKWQLWRWDQKTWMGLR